uniref:G-protein coupled receptors family 2 profile 2 domain-containing protein n=2 Tax=Acrobeloides nanus TaxID=290746 RepID=A0A914CFL2_9BILA
MNSFFNFRNKINKTYFVSLILIISVVNMGWMVYEYEKMMIFEENKVVLCTVLEFLKNDIHIQFWLCLIICVIYLVLWIAIESKKRLIHTSETRRVMKPLSVFAIIITLTWFGIFFSNMVITNYVAEHVLLIINLSLLNIGISCHFLVYYVMSDEYRNAFIRLRSYFSCQKKMTRRRNHVVPMYAFSITRTLMVVPLKPIEKLQNQQQQQQHHDDDFFDLHNIGFM